MVIRRLVIVLIALVPVLAACSTVKTILGSDSRSEPTALKSAESRWLLIKNPRFGDVPSEPEYVWVEEDKTPVTVSTLVFGKSSIIAPPEIVAKYGSPPGGGRISPRQHMPTQSSPAAATTTPAQTPPRGLAGAPQALNGKAPAGPKKGLVLYVDTTRIVHGPNAAVAVR